MKIMLSRKEMHENFRKYLKKIYRAIQKTLTHFDAYLFGSIIEGKRIAASDIDILIVSDVKRSHIKRAEIIAEIEERAGLPLSHPFEIHLIDTKQYETWKEIYKLKVKPFKSYI
jgi:predicted nucleotidyltransferase